MKYAILTSYPAARIAATGTIASRMSRSNSSLTSVPVAASASPAASAHSAGTAKLAPSPPKTNGKAACPNAFDTAEITAAPAMFTALYRPASIAFVELTTSARPSTQPSGRGRYLSMSAISRTCEKTGRAARTDCGDESAMRRD